MLHGELPSGFSMKTYPVPNAIPAVTIGLRGLIMSSEMADKFVMSAVVFRFALASIYLFRSAKIAERNPILLVPLLFVFNCWFFSGELSYPPGSVCCFVRRIPDLSTRRRCA
jgi:hypothetical protein